MGRTACTEPQCLYKGALYHLHLYKPKSLGVHNKDIITITITLSIFTNNIGRFFYLRKITFDVLWISCPYVCNTALGPIWMNGF